MQLHAPNFSLAQTIESGQLFRYERVDEGFLVCHADKAFLISQDDDTLQVHACTPNVTAEWLSHFFSLDTEAPQAVDEFSAAALAHCGGLRVCKQDPWECTVGFICSQNNNIKRIRQLMSGLASAFGTRVHVGCYDAYLFPQPGKIRAGAKLQQIRAGYREKYLLAANAIDSGWLKSLGSLPYDEARGALLSLHGIGPKVADCILLFAYGHRNAFPIDTWVQQIMREQYGGGSQQAMHTKAREQFGDTAGVMQQYLFHYRRNQQ